MTESEIQQLVVQWCDYQGGRFKDARKIYAIPNQGARTVKNASRLKAEGMRAGIPDLCLPVAAGGYHGLYIEMKTEKGVVRKNQTTRLKELADDGYKAVVCRSFEEATGVIMGYLTS